MIANYSSKFDTQSSKNAVVLFSGGQDSTTCLVYAKQRFEQVFALGIHYGQRHDIELKQAKKIASLLEVEYTVLNLQNIELWQSSALIGENEQIETTPDKEMPNSFVPGRNLLFLNYAGIFAYNKQAGHIVIGACQTDFSGYPDCRHDFIVSAEKTLSKALGAQLTIHAPLMWMTKAETVRFMDRMGQLDILKESHTCYYGKRPPCGKCPACQLRQRGFEEAGIIDPITLS